MTVSTDTLHGLIVFFSWLALVSTLFVMLGIYLEGGSRINDVEYPTHVKRGERFVLSGVMGEFGFGILVFILAGTVDTRQRAEIARLEKETARLNADNLDLEAATTPRGICMTGDTVPTLKKFAGGKVRLQIDPDSETRRLGNTIYGLLSQSGWTVETVIDDPAKGLPQSGIRDGVNIFLSNKAFMLRMWHPESFTPLDRSIFERTLSAADALQATLEMTPVKAGERANIVWLGGIGTIDVQRHNSEIMKIGLDEMVVTVGMRSAMALEAKRAMRKWDEEADRDWEARKIKGLRR